MARLHSIPLLLAALAAVSCADVTAPPASDSTYDLIFESMGSASENASRLFVLPDGANAPTPLFGDGSYASQPRVSADGRWIAYVAPRPEDGAGAVWLARTDGTGRRQVFATDETLSRPAPSPDGSRIAFQVTDPTTGSSRIWLANADGSGAYAITLEQHPAPYVHAAPAWSPDGTRLALAVGTPDNLRIATMSAEGGALTMVTQPASGSDTEPSWSPSGTHLVFTYTRTPALSDLVIVTLASGSERTLYTGNAHHPAWSPTGQVIAFSARIGGQAADLYAMPAAGGEAQRVTTTEVSDRYPNWVRRTP
jgi:Tol biopolymer transport system component